MTTILKKTKTANGLITKYRNGMTVEEETIRDTLYVEVMNEDGKVIVTCHYDDVPEDKIKLHEAVKRETLHTYTNENLFRFR